MTTPQAAGRGTPIRVAGAPVDGTDEVQTLTVSGSPTGGTFTLGFGSYETAAIAYDAAASAVQTALRAINPLTTDGVSVTGSAGGPWTVTFDGTNTKKRAMPILTLSDNSLTGGSSPSVGIVETTPGVTATGRNSPTGARAIDTTNGDLYENEGSPGAPTWNEIGAVDADEIAADAVTEQKLLISLPVPIPIRETIAVRGGINSDGVQVGLITEGDPSDVTQEDNSAATFVDETADAASAGADDVAVPDPFDTNDALYVGYASKFFGLNITIGTQGVGDDVTGETVWEYWDGDSWEALTEIIDDSAAGEGAAAAHILSFLPPADWATTTVDGGPSAYFIRLRATADDVFNTTQAVWSKIAVLPLDSGQGLVIPFDGTLEAVDLSALTASATNNDTEFLFVNVTQGTFAQVTWTGGDAFDRVTGLSLAFTEDDELVIVTINEDGTTEFDGVTVTPQFSIG